MSTQPIKIEVVYPPSKLGHPLNVREKQVLCCMFQGYEDPEIATQLNSTVQSVKNSRREAYRKLGINSVRGLFPLIIAGNFELRTGREIDSARTKQSIPIL